MSRDLTPIKFFHHHRTKILEIFMILAEAEAPVSSRKMAEILAVSRQSIEKLAHLLQSNEFVEAKRGQMGGYVLTESPENITMLDILGPTIIPSDENHGIYEAMIKVTDLYDTITLAQLVKWNQ